MAGSSPTGLRSHPASSGFSSSSPLLSPGQLADTDTARRRPTADATPSCLASCPTTSLCSTPTNSLSGPKTPVCSTPVKSPSGLSTATTATPNIFVAATAEQLPTTPLLYTNEHLLHSRSSSSAVPSDSHSAGVSMPYHSAATVSEEANCVQTGPLFPRSATAEQLLNSSERRRDRVQLCYGPPRLCALSSLSPTYPPFEKSLENTSYDNAVLHPCWTNAPSAGSVEDHQEDSERSSERTANSFLRRLSSSTQGGGSVLSSFTGSDLLSLSSVSQPAGVVSRRGRSELFFLIGFLLLVFLFFGILLPFSEQPPAAKLRHPGQDREATEWVSGLVGADTDGRAEARNTLPNHVQVNSALSPNGQSHRRPSSAANEESSDEVLLPSTFLFQFGPSTSTPPSTSGRVSAFLSRRFSAAREDAGDSAVSPPAQVSPCAATSVHMQQPVFSECFPLLTSLLGSSIFPVLSALPPVFLFLLVVALACCCACIFISSALVYKHLTHYYEPDLQRYICRICLVGPAFAVASLAYFAHTLLDAVPPASSLSLSWPSNSTSQVPATGQSRQPSPVIFSAPSDTRVFSSSRPAVEASAPRGGNLSLSPNLAFSRDSAASEARLEEVFIEFLRDMAQAGALYSFLVLMINCCGSDRCISLTLACNPHPVKPVPPLNLFFPPFHPAPHILRYMKVGVMQCVLFVPLMGVVSLLQAIARTDSSTLLAGVKGSPDLSARQASSISWGANGERNPEALTPAGGYAGFAGTDSNSARQILLPVSPSKFQTRSQIKLLSDLSSPLFRRSPGENSALVVAQQDAHAASNVSTTGLQNGHGSPTVAVESLQSNPVTVSSEGSRLDYTASASAPVACPSNLCSLLSLLWESRLLTVPALTSVVLLGSIFVCMLSLLQFYVCTESLVRPYKPLQKFLSIKLLVFFQVWQRLAINILLGVGVIQANPVFEAAQMADLYHNILMSVWMIFISLSHVHCFPVTDHLPEVVGASAPAEPPATLLQSLVEVFLAVDVLQDAREIALVPHRSLDRACSILHDQCVKADNELHHLLLPYEPRNDQDSHVNFPSPGLHHGTPAGAYQHSLARSASLATPQSTTLPSAARSGLFSGSRDSTCMFVAGSSIGHASGTPSEDIGKQDFILHSAVSPWKASTITGPPPEESPALRSLCPTQSVAVSTPATALVRTEKRPTADSSLQICQAASDARFTKHAATTKKCSTTAPIEGLDGEKHADATSNTQYSLRPWGAPEGRACVERGSGLERPTDDLKEPARSSASTGLVSPRLASPADNNQILGATSAHAGQPYPHEHGSHRGSLGDFCESPYGIRCPAPPPCSPASGLSSPSQGGWVSLPPLTFCLSPRAEPAFSPTFSPGAREDAGDHSQARGPFSGAGLSVSRHAPSNHFTMTAESLNIPPYRQPSLMNSAARVGGQASTSILGTASPRTPSGSIALAAASAAAAVHYPRSATARAAAAARFLMTSSAASPFHRCPATALAVALGNSAALPPFGVGAAPIDGPPSLGAEELGAILLRHGTSRDSGSISTGPTGTSGSTELAADIEACFANAPLAGSNTRKGHGGSWHTKDEILYSQSSPGEQRSFGQVSGEAHTFTAEGEDGHEGTSWAAFLSRQDRVVKRAGEAAQLREQLTQPESKGSEPVDTTGSLETVRPQLAQTRTAGKPCRQPVFLEGSKLKKLKGDSGCSGQSSPSEQDTRETKSGRDGEGKQQRETETSTRCVSREDRVSDNAPGGTISEAGGRPLAGGQPKHPGTHKEPINEERRPSCKELRAAEANCSRGEREKAIRSSFGPGWACNLYEGNVDEAAQEGATATHDDV